MGLLDLLAHLYGAYGRCGRDPGEGRRTRHAWAQIALLPSAWPGADWASDTRSKHWASMTAL